MPDKLKLLIDERTSRLLGFSSSISGYGLAAIRGVFVLNGSAAVAVLTKQRSITADGKSIILLCAIGAALAVLCAGTSFLAQWCRKESFLDASQQSIFAYGKTGTSQTFCPIPYVRRGWIAFWVSVLLFCSSVGCFCRAAYKLIEVL